MVRIIKDSDNSRREEIKVYSYLKPETKREEVIATKIIEMFGFIKPVLHTFTGDNGKEFAWNEKIAETPDIDFYFAHAYCSWERGLNENTNGLIRQFFPKKLVMTM